MNDKQIQALARKNASRSIDQSKKELKRRRQYDATLEVTRPSENEDEEAADLFREMKKREF